MKLLSTTIALLMAGSAFAAEPQPVPNNSIMHFSDLLQIYQNGKPADEQTLTGKWIEVAFATTKACSYNGDDAYDSTGLKSDDGSIMTLQFGLEKNGGNDFSGAPATQAFVVRILNLGNKDSNQGPYKADSKEPQFAIWGYNSWTHQLADSTYYSSSCRLMNGSNNKLVCATGLTVKDNAPSEILRGPSPDCAKDQPGIMYGYVKVQ